MEYNTQDYHVTHPPEQSYDYRVKAQRKAILLTALFLAVAAASVVVFLIVPIWVGVIILATGTALLLTWLVYHIIYNAVL